MPLHVFKMQFFSFRYFFWKKTFLECVWVHARLQEGLHHVQGCVETLKIQQIFFSSSLKCRWCTRYVRTCLVVGREGYETCKYNVGN